MRTGTSVSMFSGVVLSVLKIASKVFYRTYNTVISTGVKLGFRVNVIVDLTP